MPACTGSAERAPFMLDFTPERLVPKKNEQFQTVDQSAIAEITEPLTKCYRRIFEKSSDSERQQEHISELSSLLLVALKEAQSFDAKAQLEVVNLVATDILGISANDGPAEIEELETLLRECGWDVLYLLESYMTTGNGDNQDTFQVRQVAANLFQHVGSFLRPKELFLIVSEKMSTVDWKEFLENEGYSISTSIILANYLRLLQDYGVSKITDAKRLSQHITYPITFCARMLTHLGDMITDKSSFDKSTAGKPSENIILVLTTRVLDLIHACARYQPSWIELFKGCGKKSMTFYDLQRDPELWLWYLSSYLLLLTFEKILLPMDMRLSELYCHYFQQRYPIKVQPSSQNKTKGVNVSDYTNNTKIHLARRCMNFSLRQGLLFDNALLVRRWWDSNSILLSDTNDDDHQEDTGVEHLPFPYNGIASLLAFSVYFAYLPSEEQFSCLHTMPTIIQPEWIGRECLGLTLNLMTQSQKSCVVDKGLLVLLYLSDNVEFALALKTLQDTKLQGPMDGKSSFTIINALQVMSSVAASCPEPSIRFISYQLISRFIELCNEDARMFVFLDLFHECPYPAMLAATAGLFKQQIDMAFNSTIPSCFNSRVVSDKFFPEIFQEPKKDMFWQMYGYHMQVVNLYLFLLIRDKLENKTRVWEPDVRSWVDKTYFNPLLKICNELLERPAADNNEAQAERMQIEMLKDNIERVKEQKQQ